MISHFERHKKVKDLWSLDMREELDLNKTQLLHRKQLYFCSSQAAFGCYRAVQHSACTCYQSTNSFKCPNHLLVNSRLFKAVQPDVVMVELCKSRTNILVCIILSCWPFVRYFYFSIWMRQLFWKRLRTWTWRSPLRFSKVMELSRCFSLCVFDYLTTVNISGGDVPFATLYVCTSHKRVGNGAGRWI